MKFTVFKMTILALQAIVAAIFEERFAVTSDKDGFRDGNGHFRSKKYAIIRLMAGVGGIAISVQIVPFVVKNFYPHPIIQGFGTAIIATVILAHVAVEAWTINLDDWAIIGIGFVIFFVPYIT